MGTKRKLDKPVRSWPGTWHWLKENPSVLAALITAVGSITAALLSKLF
jgi:hypothetical protein